MENAKDGGVRKGQSYRTPTPSMKVKTTFLATGSCSFHSTGIGRMTIVRSVIKLRIPTAS